MKDHLEINHQIVYLHPKNAMAMSMNLLSFGYLQFNRITLIKERGKLKSLCERFSTTNPPNPIEITEFAVDQLINSIRLTICFENLMKSLLVIKGNLIHKLSKDDFPHLYKEQFKRPITIFEILERNNWERNDKLKLEPNTFNNQIKGIMKITLGMRELTSKTYKAFYNIDESVFKVCTPYFEYRNNLHLYMGETFQYYEDLYKDILILINFVNDKVVKLHNEIVDKIGKPEQYKLGKINYT